MKPWDSLSVFFRDPTLCRSVLFWTCEHFWYLICFLSCSESNDALLLEISLVSFFHSPVITLIMEIMVALPGMARGNAHLGFYIPCVSCKSSRSRRASGPHPDSPEQCAPARGAGARGSPGCSPEQTDRLLKLCLQPQKFKSCRET